MKKRKPLSVRILSLVLSVAMVTTMIPTNVFATEKSADTSLDTRNIKVFDKLEDRFIPSATSENIYSLGVPLGTPFEDLKLPTELTVTVEQTSTVSIPAEAETAPKETVTPTDAVKTLGDSITDKVEAPDTKEEPKQKETTVTETIQETVPVTETTQETVPVTWKGDKEYKANENSKVMYTAQLPESYTLSDGVKLPQIYVFVGKQGRGASISTTVDLKTITNKGTVDASGDGWSFEANTRTLTLDGLNIHVAEGNGLIMPSGSTTVVLGTNPNTVISDKAAAIYVDFVARKQDPIESLTVQGSGSLTATGAKIGIEGISNGAITIESGTVTAIGGTDGCSNTYGINVSGGKLMATGTTGYGIKTSGSYASFSGGIVNAEGGKGGNGGYGCNISGDANVETWGDIILSSITGPNAKLTCYGGIIGKSSGIVASGATIEGANEKFISGTTTKLTQQGIEPIRVQFFPSVIFDARNGENVDVMLIDKDTKTVTVPSAPSWKGYTFEGWYTGIDGGGTAFANNGLTTTIFVYAKWSAQNDNIVRTQELDLSKAELPTNPGDQGWTWKNNTLTLNGIILEGGAKECIKLPDVNATVTLTGDNFIAKGTSDYGISAAGALCIDGTGSLQCDSGIEGKKGIDIKNTGTIAITGGGSFNGLSTDTSGDIMINGGTLNISATSLGHGIYAKDGSITIDGENTDVTVIAENTGLYARGITIKNGRVSSVAKLKNTYKNAFHAMTGSVITATGATVKGNDGTFNSGVTTILKQASDEPVVIRFDQSITVGAQSDPVTYGTKGTPTFTVVANGFGSLDFKPSVEWTEGKVPAGVTTSFSETDHTLTVHTAETTPTGEYKFRVTSPKDASDSWKSNQATLKIDKKEVTIKWGSTSLPYNGSVQAPTAIVDNKVGNDDVTVTVTGGETNIGTGYTATASGLTGTAAGNYILPSLAQTQTFSIVKGTYRGTQATAPDAATATKTADSITLPSKTVAGQTVEYGYRETESGTITWQDSTTFHSLDPNKEYLFYARVKESDNYEAGTVSAGTKIKTNMSNSQKVAAAKIAVVVALDSFTATNETNGDAILTLAKKAISDAGITDVTLSWDASGAFGKTDADEDSTGSITGTLKLTCNDTSDTVVLDKTIAKLPNGHDARITKVKTAIETAWKDFKPTNETTVDDVKTFVEQANTDSGVTGVTVEWKTGSPKVEKATTSAPGSVTGTMVLRSGSKIVEIIVSKAIAQLPSKQVIVDKATGIAIEYEDGRLFDSEVVFVVISKSAAEIKKFQVGVDKVAKGSSIGGLYDFKLLKAGVEIQPDGKLKISLALTDEAKTMADLQVAYIDDNGNVTIIPSQLINGKLVFFTDHFSYYAVIGKVKETAPTPTPTPTPVPAPDTGKGSVVSKTGDTTNAAMYIVLAVVSGVTTIILQRKRRYFSRKTIKKE